MSNASQISQMIDDSALPFPQQMLMVDDVFRFSFAEAQEVMRRIGLETDMATLMQDVSEDLRTAALDPGEADLVISLLAEEMEVVAFSRAARSSVIRL